MTSIISYILNLKFLSKVAEFDPALARAIEIAIYALFAYFLGLIITGSIFSINDMVAVVLVPLMAYLSKIKRDLEKQKEEIEANN